ncbi:hypothetical protein WJX77_003681 [Trebouxia sp. C0004]
MAAGRGKGDPMAGLLSGLGGIDPNLFNKPTMGQLRNKQQSPAVPPKPVSQPPRPDTIAAVGSPVRSEAGPSDSFSSQRSPATKTNPKRSGAVADDLDSFFGSAKPSAPPSTAGSYAPSPANMASPAASLGHPDTQQDADFFGNFSPAPQPAGKASAASARQVQHQQVAMDPFDLFGEGSTVPAPVAAASQEAGADDGLFGDIQGSVSHAQHQQDSHLISPPARTPEPQRQDLLPARSPKSVTSYGQPPQRQGRSTLPRRSSSFTTAGSPDSRSSAPDSFTQGSLATDRLRAAGRATPGGASALGSTRQYGSSSSSDTTAAVQGSPGTSASPLSSLGQPQRTPSLRTRRSSDDGRGSRKGPLEEGASPAAEAASGGRHPDPYMHEDPYMVGGQSGGRAQGSGNVEQTAKQWLTGGQKWLKSAGKKLATVAKESASEIQKRLETVDVKMHKGKGMRVGDDGEEVPAYYHQWAVKIQDMSPARQADVLDQLGEEDRLIVQRILDHAAVQRSNDSAMSGISQSQRSCTRPVSPIGSDSSPRPLPYPGATGTSWAGSSHPSTRPASPQAERAGDSRKSAQAEQGARNAESASARQTSAQQKLKLAADLGIFDFESQSSAEMEETHAESRAAESRLADPEPVRAAPQSTSAPAQHSQQRPQQPAPIEADFLGFGSGQEAAEEIFMPDSPPADSSQAFAAELSQSPYPVPPGPQAATPDGLADFFSAPVAASSSSEGRAQSSTAHIDDMFSAGPTPAPKPSAAASPAASSSQNSRQSPGGGVSAGAGTGSKAVPKPAPKAAPASMIDFGDEAKLLAENPDLYKGLEEVAGEPAYRKELREKRLREMHQRMQAQLAEKLARDAAESSEKEEKVDLRGRIVKPRIDAWTQGKKDNIRALLSTLHTVLWEGSGWNPPGMTDLVETGKVKKQYMKANLIIHPDKVKQKGGTVEQIVIADMAFDVLKTAWAKFESGELRK